MDTKTTEAPHPDTVKKWMTCLGCGRRIWTDRCHRICKKCRRRNADTPARTAHGVSLPQGASVAEAECSSRSSGDW